jgi:hypothetical protein
LKINNKLRQHVHLFDELADVAGSAVLERQVVADLVTSGDQIFAIISGQPDEVVTRK